MFKLNEELIEDIDIDVGVLADNNIHKEYIMKNIVNKNKNTGKDIKNIGNMEDIFKLDEKCDIEEENGSSINKTNNNYQLLPPSSNLFNISTEKAINKTNTPKPIEKKIYTISESDVESYFILFSQKRRKRRRGRI